MPRCFGFDFVSNVILTTFGIRLFITIQCNEELGAI